MAQIIKASVKERFNKWYVKPLCFLQNSVSGGDGAVVALMTVLPLYERFVLNEIGGNDSKRPPFVQKDLKLKSLKESCVFWNVFRDGLCHTGHFFEQSSKSLEKEWVLPKVSLAGSNPPLPVFDIDPTTHKEVIYVNPWGLVSHIMDKYKNNTKLMEKSGAPLIPLYYIIEDRKPQ